MSYRYILTENLDGVTLITLNRPEKLNALNFGMARDLDVELTRIENNDAAQVVVLTGAGNRAFSAGADIYEMVGLSPEELAARQDFRQRATWHIATFRKPIIGAINGLAYGGAALLSSMLDIRIGCERTTFRFLAANYGRANSTWSLPIIIGMGKAKELLYTGRLVKAEEAEHIGLLNQVVPSADLRDAAIQMARMIARNDARMVQGIKRLLHDQIGMSWRDRYDNEREARESWLAPTAPREGFREFLNRKGWRE